MISTLSSIRDGNYRTTQAYLDGRAPLYRSYTKPGAHKFVLTVKGGESNDPRYKRKIGNPFSFDKIEKCDLTGLHTRLPKGVSTWEGAYTVDGTAWGVPEVNYASLNDPYNKALEKLYDEVRRSTDLAVDIAEGSQTFRMFKGLLRTMRHPIDAILSEARNYKTFQKRTKYLGRGRVYYWKEFKLAPIRGVSKTASDAWLAWTYGLRPVLQSLYDSLTPQFEVLQGTFKVSGRGGFQTLGSVVLNAKTGECCKYTGSRRGLFICEFQIADVEKYVLSQYTSLNPVSVLYELIPYSFVADWFFDIGGYLRLAETALSSGLQFVGGQYTESYRYTNNHEATGSWSDAYSNYTFHAKGFYHNRGMKRTRLTQNPMPKVPSLRGLNPHTSPQRFLSAAALLRQLIN